MRAFWPNPARAINPRPELSPAWNGPISGGPKWARPDLEPGRFGPYVLEPGPSRAKKSPSRIGPAREQHY